MILEQIPPYTCAVVEKFFRLHKYSGEGSGAYDCLNLYRWVLIKNRKKEVVLSERKSKKRIVSGLLSVMTILTTVAQPLTTYAAEPEPTAFEVQYPALDAVRDMLSAEEIVTASDYEVAIGSAFDVKSDFSGLEIQTDKGKLPCMKQRTVPGKSLTIRRMFIGRSIW